MFVISKSNNNNNNNNIFWDLDVMTGKSNIVTKNHVRSHYVIIDLFSLYVLFSHFRPGDVLEGIFFPVP